MGGACSNHRRRVKPQLIKLKLGVLSGQVIQSSILTQSLILQQDPAPIKIYALNLEDNCELLKIENPSQYCSNILHSAYADYHPVQLIKATTQSLSMLVSDKQQNSYCFRRSIFNIFQQASHQVSYLLNLKSIQIPYLHSYTNLQLVENKKGLDEEYCIDRFSRVTQGSLETLISVQPDFFQSYDNLLDLLQQILKVILSMHKQGFSYRFLRPENILIKDSLNENHFTYYLDFPTLEFNQAEINLRRFLVKEESDYYYYDSTLIGVLLLSILNSHFSFDQYLSMRVQQKDWMQAVGMATNMIKEENSHEVPLMIIQAVEQLTQFSRDKQLTVEQIHNIVTNVASKGQQTSFKFDSLGAYLYYHNEVELPILSPWMYFAKKNQIHLYNLETQQFHYLKVFRKKKQFEIQTHFVYHPQVDKFFMFSSKESSLLLKVYDEAHNRSMLCYRREVELFRHLKGLQFENSQLVLVEMEDNVSQLFIFNNLQQQDELNGSSYYSSYIIQFSETIDEKHQQTDEHQHEHEAPVTKLQIRIFEGPRNYQWRRWCYHFYDPHNHFIYCIPDANNIFSNGIKYSYYDVTLDKGKFKEGVLKFACSSSQLFIQFCELNIKIWKINFCVEIQHGVFMLQASKNIFVLDFNFKCFYSFASIQQLQTYSRLANHKQNQMAFPILNLPFDLKYPFSLNLGKSAIFYKGHLHILARKEIETVHCVFEIQSNQAQLKLLNCFSLYSGLDLLTILPRSVTSLVFGQLPNNEDQNKKPLPSLKQVGSYKCLTLDQETQSLRCFTVENEKGERFQLQQYLTESLFEVSELCNKVAKRLDSQLLMIPEDQFISQESDIYMMNYVSEEWTQNLFKEVATRQINKLFFKPKEMGLLIKIIFEGLNELSIEAIEHGNLTLNNCCINKHGMIKLCSWYLPNRKPKVNDTIDALTTIFQLATLNTNEIQLTQEQIHASEYELSQYEGLSQFLTKHLPVHDQKFRTTLFQAIELSKKLQVSEIDFSLLRSNSQALIWVGYRENYLIVTRLSDKSFFKITVSGPKGESFKFSKYNMFTYDFKSTIYISGAVKDELKTQQFYQIKIGWEPTENIKLQRLPDIPFGVINPTLIFCKNQVFSIGGYEVRQNLSKVISPTVLSYSVKYKSWKTCAKLPFGMVNSTALYSAERDQIFLLGGVSEDVDLTTDRLVYFTYDLQADSWKFTLDMSFKSPFINSRFIKPIVDLVNEEFFINVLKEDNEFKIDIFEFTRGGVSLKMRIVDHGQVRIHDRDDKTDFDPFEDQNQHDNKLFLQDDLSMAVYKDQIFIMDEQTKHLNMFKINDVSRPKLDFIPCFIQGTSLEQELKPSSMNDEEAKSQRSFEDN